jgi:hypothetical protein
MLHIYTNSPRYWQLCNEIKCMRVPGVSNQNRLQIKAFFGHPVPELYIRMVPPGASGAAGKPERVHG